MKLSKKSMMVGQIFIYSLSLIVVGLILVFGYKIIMEFLVNSNTVEQLQFEKNVKSMVRSYSSEWGSVGYKKLVAPSSVKEICFTDYNSQAMTLTDCNDPTNTDFYLFIEDSYGDPSIPREKKNLFLIGASSNFIESYYVGNVSLGAACNYLCVKSERGAFSLKIVGKGDHVELAEKP